MSTDPALRYTMRECKHTEDEERADLVELFRQQLVVALVLLVAIILRSL